jgi:nucleoside-diphosphate-sugar epimerase
MRVLITGGAGGMGINVCKAFLEEGFDVRVFDLGNRVNRKRVRFLGGSADIVWGDITQLESARRAMDGVDAVVHLAAIIPPLTEENPDLAARVNVGGTQTVVDLIKEKPAPIPFVFTSSVAVFGPTPDATKPLHPDRNYPNPRTTYARTKVQAEELIKDSGIPYLILRLTSIPYLRFKLRLRDMRYHMFSIPLENRLEFCHLDDLALAIINAVKKFDEVRNNTLIIGGGPSQQMVYEDMLRAVLRPIGLPLPPRHKFSKKPYDLDWYDTSRSQELLNFQRKTLEDYTRDLARQFPAPFLAFVRYIIGPTLGPLIVRVL